MPTPARVVVVPPHAGPLEVQDLSLPDPGPHQVVVKLLSSGVCHSQLHQMHAPRQNPVVLGHEATGTVIAAGKRVNHVKEGDTTIVTWVPRNAPRTKRRPDPAVVRVAGGAEAMSQNVFCWADHTIADEQFVVKVPDNIQKDVTAIIGCAVITGAGAVKNTARVRAGRERRHLRRRRRRALRDRRRARGEGESHHRGRPLRSEARLRRQVRRHPQGERVAGRSGAGDPRDHDQGRRRLRHPAPPARRRRLGLRLHRRQDHDGADRRRRALRSLRSERRRHRGAGRRARRPGPRSTRSIS